MPTQAIYKPVSGGEAQDENGVVIFTIDSLDDNMNAEPCDEEDHDPSAAKRDGSFEMETVHPMEISSYSFSDDDLSEQLFGWRDPWLPSVTVTLMGTAPVLLGNVWMFYDLTGSWFFSTPFVFHLIVMLCAARHLVSVKLTLLRSPGSRIFTSVASWYVHTEKGVH